MSMPRARADVALKGTALIDVTSMAGSLPMTVQQPASPAKQLLMMICPDVVEIALLILMS